MSKLETTWIEEFEKLGAFWEHDGNPKRPYVRLASEKISNGFFNAGKVARHANVLHRAAKVLVNTHWEFMASERSRLGLKPPLVIIGPAMGGITLAHEIASFMHAETIVAEKSGDTFVLPREQPVDDSTIILCEDTLTTGGSVLKVRDMITRTYPNVAIAPFVLAVLNRSGKEIVDGLAIKSLIRKSFQVWEEGSNPFTPEGKELVPPVKAKLNWEALTKAY
jgi:orotate phosphoribosyltransferase